MTDLTFAVPSNIVHRNISDYLGIKPSASASLNKLIESIEKIRTIMDFHKIDEETALGLFKSFESKHQAEDVPMRLSNFLSFISSIADRDNLIATAKNMGMLSKSELESQALITGNWIPYMKRVEHDNRVAAEQLVEDVTNVDGKEEASK